MFLISGDFTTLCNNAWVKLWKEMSIMILSIYNVAYIF